MQNARTIALTQRALERTETRVRGTAFADRAEDESSWFCKGELAKAISDGTIPGQVSTGSETGCF